MSEVARFDLGALVVCFRQVHEHLAAKVGKAVNIGLALRNWAFGRYIREYEHNGADQATYGDNLLEDGCVIRTVQGFPGHKHMKTTTIHAHFLNRGPGGVRSPADRLWKT